MLKNYYYLNRTITELNRTLAECEVTDIYSQQKNSLLLAIPTVNLPYRHLFISTNPGLPYLVIKDEHHKAKKNLIEFDLFPETNKIEKFEIAKDDRIIKITFTDFELLFIIMGGNTNIFFLHGNSILAKLKKNKDDKTIIKTARNKSFTSQNVYHKIEESLFKDFNTKKIKQKYSFIPKEIITELKLIWNNGYKTEELFHSLIGEVYNGKIKVFENKIENRIRFVPEEFKSFPTDKFVLFDDVNSAIKKYLQLHFRLEKISKLKTEISKHLFRQLEKVSNKLNNLRGRIENGDKSKEYYNIANLLLTNRHLLKKGLNEIELTDYSTNRTIKIKLDKTRTPQEEINRWFEKARDEKINFQKSKQLEFETGNSYNRLKNLEEKFNNAKTTDDYLEIKKRLNIKEKKEEKQKMYGNAKLRELLIDDKYKVLVGRDSKSNDMLSIKIAKQNDYWFHARGLPGSHVILRVDNPKEGVPKNIIKTAAQIAAYYSKAKTAGIAPVSYTLAKFVRKKKGMEPGKVLIEKEKVLLVRPEIPKNVEVIS